jgi:Ca2+-binding EF-hand superfamily protein
MSTTARGTGARREEEMVAPNVHKHHTHDHKDEVRQLFAQYDSNKDGRLALDEVARLFKERRPFSH